jgi:hypothetical protein
VLGLFSDIGQVPSRNFYWLPFTPPLVAFSGPSISKPKEKLGSHPLIDQRSRLDAPITFRPV